MTPEDDLSAQLRSAIEASGKSFRELESETGIPYQSIWRYASGARENITIETAGRLAKALGLRLTYASVSLP